MSACPLCRDAGWVVDAKLDQEPTTLELIPCVEPSCQFSGRAVSVLCLYGEWERPTLHPFTQAIMSVERVDHGLFPSSSNVTDVIYWPGASLLRVDIEGEPHIYSDVPPDVYSALLKAPSRGSYFNRIIRGHYERVEPDRLIAAGSEGDPQ